MDWWGMASGTKSVWKPGTGGASQQSVLVSMDDLDDGAEWTFSRLAGEPELG